MSTPKLYSERELLERLTYLGPIQAIGGGVTKTYDWTQAVTEDTIWTPQSGNRFIISMIAINASGACTVSVFDEDDSEVDRIFKGTLAANATVVIPFPIPRCSREVNRKLQVTTSATGGFITVYGWESGTADESTTTSVSTSSSSISTTTHSTSSSSISQTTSSTSSSSISTTSHTTSSSSLSYSTSVSISQTTSSSSVSSTSHTTSSSSHSITYL